MDMYDLAVIGLGAMGSAALWQARSRGLHCIGIDRFAPPHDRGSSHGETRITRQAIGEAEDYVPLVLRSHELWNELEQLSGRRLFERCGFLLIEKPGACSVHGKGDFAARTFAAADRFGIAHERLDADDVASRFPRFVGLDGSESIYFEPGGGYLYPEECIRVQLGLAAEAGAGLATGRRVDALRPRTGCVEIDVEGERLAARRVIISTGPWIAGLAGDALRPWITVERQVLHWFPAQVDALRTIGREPVFIRIHSSGQLGQFYGFPPTGPLREVKIAEEAADGAIDPDECDRNIFPGESRAMFARHALGRMAGLVAEASRSTACFYTTTPDGDFIIDRHPADDRIVVVSACSGHGFKHSAAVGEAAVRIALDDEPPGLGRFRLSRFQKGHPT